MLKTRVWERGRAGEGRVINNSPAHPIYCTHEEELLWENPDDSSRTWHPRARQEVERGQEAAREAAKQANIDIRVIKWHAPYRNETAHN